MRYRSFRTSSPKRREFMPVVVDNPYIINCTKFPEKPFTPDGWSVVFHREMKGFLDLRRIILIPAKKVWNQMFEKGECYEIDGKKYVPLNACLLDYFRENLKCVPDELKQKTDNGVRHIFFPGTEYFQESSRKDCAIRYFVFEGGVPGWFYRSKNSSPESSQYVAFLTA